MKKQELKKLLKPMIKECIKEVIFDEGVLSGLIKEVATGLGTTTSASQEVIAASTPPSAFASSYREELRSETDAALQERKKRLEQSLGGTMGGIFENVEPLSQGGSPSADSSPQSPLSTYAPGDAGVDISGIMNLATGGKPWKQFS